MRGGDFYEDDEPLDDLLAEFEAGEKGVTEPRLPRGRTEFFNLRTTEPMAAFDPRVVGNVAGVG